MDDKGRETLNLLAEANLRLAALFRRQNQPEVAIPLLVEVVKTMTPTNETGRKAYQQLVELGFVVTPYTAPGSSGGT
jgi:thiazole synthase ThiGH ThiG subunit